MPLILGPAGVLQQTEANTQISLEPICSPNVDSFCALPLSIIKRVSLDVLIVTFRLNFLITICVSLIKLPCHSRTRALVERSVSINYKGTPTSFSSTTEQILNELAIKKMFWFKNSSSPALKNSRRLKANFHSSSTIYFLYYRADAHCADLV